MHPSYSFPVRALAVALVMAVGAQPSFAACTRLGFSVNDYGKDGPTKDAKGLLDKYIAKWAADHGVAKYRTGTKEVKCELFLNLIVFDEHTCRAEATVCWDGAPVTPAVKAEGAPAGEPKAAGKEPGVTKRAVVLAPVKAVGGGTAKPGEGGTVVETGAIPAVAKPVIAKPVIAKPVVDKPDVAKPAVVKPAAEVAAPKPVAASSSDAALAAAQKAADAAERAAAAAERAAAAAQAAERASLPATAAKP